MFGGDVISLPRVYSRNKRFQKGREDIEDYSISGRPSTSINDENVEVNESIFANRITIRETTEEIIISCGSCKVIFTNVLNVKELT